MDSDCGKDCAFLRACGLRVWKGAILKRTPQKYNKNYAERPWKVKKFYITTQFTIERLHIEHAYCDDLNNIAFNVRPDMT